MSKSPALPPNYENILIGRILKKTVNGKEITGVVTSMHSFRFQNHIGASPFQKVVVKWEDRKPESILSQDEVLKYATTKFVDKPFVLPRIRWLQKNNWDEANLPEQYQKIGVKPKKLVVIEKPPKPSKQQGAAKGKKVNPSQTTAGTKSQKGTTSNAKVTVSRRGKTAAGKQDCLVADNNKNDSKKNAPESGRPSRKETAALEPAPAAELAVAASINCINLLESSDDEKQQTPAPLQKAQVPEAMPSNKRKSSRLTSASDKENMTEDTALVPTEAAVSHVEQPVPTKKQRRGDMSAARHKQAAGRLAGDAAHQPTNTGPPVASPQSALPTTDEPGEASDVASEDNEETVEVPGLDLRIPKSKTFTADDKPLSLWMKRDWPDTDYEVEYCFAMRKAGRGKSQEYLVKWKGFEFWPEDWNQEKDVGAHPIVKAWKKQQRQP